MSQYFSIVGGLGTGVMGVVLFLFTLLIDDIAKRANLK